MATATTIITAGDSHPNHGGILPMDTLTVSENSRPAWRCHSLAGDRPDVVWIPCSPETILEDGLLQLAAVCIGDERVVELLDRAAGDRWRAEHLEVEAVIGMPSEELRAAVREAMKKATLVLTVLRESGVLGQLDVVRSLETNVEVCLPAYWRRSNQWRPEPDIGGELP